MGLFSVIVGATSSVGEAVILQLLKENQGHHFLLHYHKDKEKAAWLQKKIEESGGSSILLSADLQNSFERACFIEKALQYPIDHFIYTAGGYLEESFWQIDPQKWQPLFALHLLAPVEISLALFPSLAKQQGAVVFLGNVGLSHAATFSKATGYSLAKGALYHWMRSFAIEAAASRVSVNMVSPGVLENSSGSFSLNQIPMNRWGDHQELAKLITFILRAESRYITGQNIDYSGGYRL